MLYSYVTLDDGTQFAYSKLQDDGTVRIGIERPVDMGFDSAQCVLPAYIWSNVDGFSESEIRDFKTFLSNNAPLIFELAERAGHSRAAA